MCIQLVSISYCFCIYTRCVHGIHPFCAWTKRSPLQLSWPAEICCAVQCYRDGCTAHVMIMHTFSGLVWTQTHKYKAGSAFMIIWCCNGHATHNMSIGVVTLKWWRFMFIMHCQAIATGRTSFLPCDFQRPSKAFGCRLGGKQNLPNIGDLEQVHAITIHMHN